MLVRAPEKIEERRVCLCKPNERDAQGLSIMIRRYHAQMHANLNWPISMEKMEQVKHNIRRLTKDFNEGTRLVYHIFIAGSNVCIGRAGFFKIDYDEGLAYIGFWCFPPFEGKGYMSEALQAIVKLGEILNFKMQLEIKEDNSKAMRFSKKLGFIEKDIEIKGDIKIFYYNKNSK